MQTDRRAVGRHRITGDGLQGDVAALGLAGQRHFRAGCGHGVHLRRARHLIAEAVIGHSGEAVGTRRQGSVGERERAGGVSCNGRDGHVVVEDDNLGQINRGVAAGDNLTGKDRRAEIAVMCRAGDGHGRGDVVQIDQCCRGGAADIAVAVRHDSGDAVHAFSGQIGAGVERARGADDGVVDGHAVVIDRHVRAGDCGTCIARNRAGNRFQRHVGAACGRGRDHDCRRDVVELVNDGGTGADVAVAIGNHCGDAVAAQRERRGGNHREVTAGVGRAGADGHGAIKDRHGDIAHRSRAAGDGIAGDGRRGVVAALGPAGNHHRRGNAVAGINLRGAGDGVAEAVGCHCVEAVGASGQRRRIGEAAAAIRGGAAELDVVVVDRDGLVRHRGVATRDQ